MARSRDLEAVGVSRTELRRLLERRVIERVSRGLYALPSSPKTESQDLATAARRVPAGVVCLMSALRFHGLTTQNPFEVWMAVPHKSWRPKLAHPPLRLVYLTGAALRDGIEQHSIGGTPVRIYSAAKTVADCFKFRNKIGIDVAIEALRDYRRLHPKGLEAVWRFAQADRVGQVVRPYLEGVG
jgi:predicted transcriptional regulator of viral defense system